jgi:hypothetical protein
LERLFEVLSENGQELAGSPFREFKIYAVHKSPVEESLPQCIFDIKFEKNLVKSNYNGKNNEKYEGKIGLYNAVINQKNILDINIMSFR